MWHRQRSAGIVFGDELILRCENKDTNVVDLELTVPRHKQRVVGVGVNKKLVLRHRQRGSYTPQRKK